MTNNTHNHHRTAKQCGIFDTYDSTELSNTLKITTLEDLRGDGCSYTTDKVMINQVLCDFSGDHSVTMGVSKDLTHEGLILTLSDSCQQPTSTSRIHSNMIGHTERDEEGWTWYSGGLKGMGEKIRPNYRKINCDLRAKERRACVARRQHVQLEGGLYDT